MKQRPLAILSLICLVSFIYVLRDHKTSPVNFLQRHASRMLATTSLTEALCDGADNEAISESERETAESLRSSISKFREGNQLMDYLNSSSPSTEFVSDYVPPLVKTLIPWAIFFLVSLLGCIGFVTNWCCMNCCECGPQCCKAPKTPRFQKCYKIGTGVFMILTFGAGIAGIAISAKFPPAGKSFLCSTGVLLDKLLDGSPSDHWVGALPAVDKMVILLDNVETISAQLPVALLAPTVLQYGSTYTNARSAFVTFRDDYDQNSVARGDKTVAATYIPTYTANMASDNAQTGGAGALIKEIDDKKTILDTTAPEKYLGGIVFLKSATFLGGALNVFEEVRDSAVNASRNLTKIRDSLVENGGSARTGMDAIGGGMIGIFALKMLLAIIAMISVILVSRISRFNKMLHCNWCTLGFIVILGWILATVLFPLSVILFEACEVVERVLVDETFFNKTMDKVFNDTDRANDDPNKNGTRNTLYRCIYGDGDLIADYRVYLFPFKNISDSLDLLAPMDASAPGTVVNSVQLDRQIPLIDNYKNGLISDAPEATTDLTKLNTYTNNDGCSQIHDTWQLASASCVNDGSKFISGAAADFNVGGQTCIGFDQWPATASYIQNRYTSDRFSGCPNVGAKAPQTFRQDFVNDFKTSRTAVTTLFTDIATDIQTPKSQNDLFMQRVLAYTAGQPKTIRQTYDPIYQALSNQTEGIMPNAYCTFVKAALIEVEERLCYRMAPVIFQVAIVMIISSFIALFSVIMTFCSAKRNLVEEKRHGDDRRGKYQTASHTEV